MVARTRGVGGYLPSEEHIVITASTYTGGGHPVVVCHGGGDGGDQYEPIASRRDLNVLADTGLVVCAADLGGLHTWGRDEGTAAVTAMLAWLAAHPVYQADISKVVFVADSHGALTAVNWGVRNPVEFAAAVLRVPTVALDSVHDRNGAGFADTIEGCYNALVLPGTSGAYASTPDHASLDIVGDLDLRADLAMADWTPAAFSALIAKSASTGQRSYQLGVTSGGRLEFRWYTDGEATTFTAQSTVAPTVADGARLAVRVTFDVDNGAGGRTVTFYTAPSITGPWTQLGSPVTSAGVTSIFAGTSPLEIGSLNGGTGNRLTGTVYAAEVRNGIGGIVAADPTFGRATATITFADGTGKTWTRNGTATYAGYEAAVPTHDPSHPTMVAQQIALGLVPKMRCFYDTADPIVLPAEVEGYCSATGVQLTALSGTGNHEPWSKVHAEAQASWIWDRLT